MPYKDKEKQKEKNRDYQKLHYQKKKEYYKNKAKEREARLRIEFAEFKKTLACKECGENHPATLDFHHINPEDKDLAIADMIKRGWGIEKTKNELEKCIVLCSNCHRKLHYNEKLRVRLEGPAVVS
jgi:predicted HNH restriction endonuclease